MGKMCETDLDRITMAVKGRCRVGSWTGTLKLGVYDIEGIQVFAN